MAKSESPWILYGSPGSLYTGKVRAFLRRQRIDFEERMAGDARFRAEVVPAVGRWIIPVMQTPAGEWLQDGAVILDHFEARGLARVPATPVGALQRVVALVFELFGGEGLLRPAMHYRWNFDSINLDFVRADFCAGLATPGSPPEEQAAVFARASSMMRKATASFGVTPESIPQVEASYLEFLAHFEAHLAHSPYLLGGHPTRGDYGLIAPLYAHLGRDPCPALLMKQRAPRVWRWVERMNASEPGLGEYPQSGTELFADDGLNDTLRQLLRFVAEDYLPELRAHMAFTRQWLAERPDLPAGHNGLDKPGARVIGMARFEWRGVTLSTAVMPYRQYLLQRVQDAFAALSPDDQSRVRTELVDVGLGELLTLRVQRRVERQGHLEVWGPPVHGDPTVAE